MVALSTGGLLARLCFFPFPLAVARPSPPPHLQLLEGVGRETASAAGWRMSPRAKANFASARDNATGIFSGAASHI